MNRDHFCPRKLEKKCAICEVNSCFDEIDVEKLQLIRNKFKKAKKILIDAKEDFKQRSLDSFENINFEIDIQVESLKAELDRERNIMLKDLERKRDEAFKELNFDNAIEIYGAIDINEQDEAFMIESVDTITCMIQEIYDARLTMKFQGGDIDTKKAIGPVDFKLNKMFYQGFEVYKTVSTPFHFHKVKYIGLDTLALLTKTKIKLMNVTAGSMCEYKKNKTAYDGVYYKQIPVDICKVSPRRNLVLYQLQVYNKDVYEMVFFNEKGTQYHALFFENYMGIFELIDRNRIAFTYYENNAFCLRIMDANNNFDLTDFMNVKINCNTLSMKLVRGLTNNLIAYCSDIPSISILNYISCETQDLVGHTSEIIDMQCLKEKNLLISCSNDETIRMWDYVNGICLKVFNVVGKCNSMCIVERDFRNFNLALVFDDQIKYCKIEELKVFSAVSKTMFSTKNNFTSLACLPLKNFMVFSRNQAFCFKLKI